MASELLQTLPMKVLIACDKFKDALNADAACSVIAETLAALHPSWTLEQVPIADGGDGFCRALLQLAGGEERTVEVLGPLGEMVTARFALVPLENAPVPARAALELPSEAKTLGVVELAQSSGIALVPPSERTPWRTTTFGLGQQIRAAAGAGVDALLVGLGGSATHDLALGALQALGFEFRNRHGKPIPGFPSPDSWAELGFIEPPDAPPLDIPVRIACDVDNPLVGPNGAAAVFAPQKGLKPTELDELDSLTARAAIILAHACDAGIHTMDTPGAGAAGGAAFGLMTALRGQLVSGSELIAAWTQIETRLREADIVITGEGRFDASSLQGKGPGYILRRAIELGKRVYVLAGSLGKLPKEIAGAATFVPISPPELPLPEAIAGTRVNLASSVLSTFGTPAKAATR